MKSLTLTSHGNTTGDVLLALEETMRLIREGVTRGFDRNESGQFAFELQDSPEDDKFNLNSTPGENL
jgi:hypothetical protein